MLSFPLEMVLSLSNDVANAPEKVTLLTFERRSLLAWKLTHVQLPEGER